MRVSIVPTALLVYHWSSLFQEPLDVNLVQNVFEQRHLIEVERQLQLIN